MKYKYKEASDTRKQLFLRKYIEISLLQKTISTLESKTLKYLVLIQFKIKEPSHKTK